MTALSVEQGFPFFAANGTVMDGWALVQEGKVEEGIAAIERGLATWRATGAELGGSFFLGLLAEAGLRGVYLENQLHMPAVRAMREQLAGVAAAMGPPVLARASEEHGGPHSGWFWDPARQGGGVLTE